jgi:hypothetical protein
VEVEGWGWFGGGGVADMLGPLDLMLICFAGRWLNFPLRLWLFVKGLLIVLWEG